MFGVFRTAFVVVVSMAAGSWIGLGRPDLFEDRAWLSDVRSQLVSAWENRSEKALDPGKIFETKPEKPSEKTPAKESSSRPPMPHEVDPSVAPSLQPWPRLNPEVSTQRAWMIAEGPKRSADEPRRLVTLTFDDGPFLETTPTVLKLLARYDVHATFFAVGQYLERDDQRSRLSRRLLRRIVDEGHLVGNHTLDHTLLTAISHTRVLEQIDRSAAAIQRATGKYPYLFRPPYGQLDDFGRQAARERNLELVLWSAEAQDMTRDDTSQMFSELVHQLTYKQGGIVLLHDIRPTSIVVLKDLLKWLHERRYNPNKPNEPGYEIVDLPTYLRAVEDAPLSYLSDDDFVDERPVEPTPRTSARRAKKAPSK